MEYQVVYDIQQIPYHGWWIFAVGMLIVLIGMVLFIFGGKSSEDSVPPSFREKLMPVFAVAFGLLWLGGGMLNYSIFDNLRNAVSQGRCKIVEGKVEEFVPMPYEGHKMETFKVDGHRFAYSDYDLTKGFNKTKSHGGPIKEGLQVRIAYVDDDSIVKLEIAK